LYGSVTEAVLAEGGVPVFVVHARPGEKAASVFAPHHARVLVTQNGSAYDASALDAALQIIGPNGELVLVSVIPAPETVARDHFGHVIAYLDQQEEADRFKARDYLNAIAAELRNHRVPFAVKVDVRVGDPASGITLAAIEDSADLIVMATHGRTGIRRALVGSVAGPVRRPDTGVAGPSTPGARGAGDGRRRAGGARGSVRHLLRHAPAFTKGQVARSSRSRR
jgi:nucleotide-binding universal stress UspA family protein